jgi:hypothetical protein
MTTTFHLSAKELDQSFLDRLKAMFREREVAITVSDDEEQTMVLRHSLPPKGTPMSELLKLQGSISKEDAEEMIRAIEEG